MPRWRSVDGSRRGPRTWFAAWLSNVDGWTMPRRVGQIDCVADQFGTRVLGHGVADDLTVEQADRGGQVQPALRGGQLGDVTGETLPWGRGGEGASDQVRRWRGGGILPGQRATAPPGDSDHVPFRA
jgi:hypothetical protein